MGLHSAGIMNRRVSGPFRWQGRRSANRSLCPRAVPSAPECLIDGVSVRTDDSAKIILGGNSGGRMRPAQASEGRTLLAAASVGTGQALSGRHSDALVVHGKEKVYGSIP
jgi:hypothetical protein